MDNLTELNPEREFLMQPSCQEAYRVCVKYESQLVTEDDKRWIRVLGCLLFYAHKDGARVYLANSIMCVRDDLATLIKLGRLIEQNVILPCEFFFSLFPS